MNSLEYSAIKVSTYFITVIYIYMLFDGINLSKHINFAQFVVQFDVFNDILCNAKILLSQTNEAFVQRPKFVDVLFFLIEYLL